MSHRWQEVVKEKQLCLGTFGFKNVICIYDETQCESKLYVWHISTRMKCFFLGFT